MSWLILVLGLFFLVWCIKGYSKLVNIEQKRQFSQVNINKLSASEQVEYNYFKNKLGYDNLNWSELGKVINWGQRK